MESAVEAASSTVGWTLASALATSERSSPVAELSPEEFFSLPALRRHRTGSSSTSILEESPWGMASTLTAAALASGAAVDRLGVDTAKNIVVKNR